jgi:hypothetical protein
MGYRPHRRKERVSRGTCACAGNELCIASAGKLPSCQRPKILAASALGAAGVVA